MTDTTALDGLPKDWHAWPRKTRQTWLDVHPEAFAKERVTLALQAMTPEERQALWLRIAAELPIHKRVLRSLRRPRP